VQVTDKPNLLERSSNRSRQQHTGLTGIVGRSDRSSSGSDEKTFRCSPKRDPVRANMCRLVLMSAGRLGRPRIVVEMKEEQRLEFGKVGQRDKSMKRQKKNICFNCDDCSQSAVAPCIYRVGRSCPIKTHQIYL
jgi:hypothetical protein